MSRIAAFTGRFLQGALVLGLLELKPGTSVSGLLLLAVRGKVFHRELGWPATKTAGTGGGPESWPLLQLVE